MEEREQAPPLPPPPQQQQQQRRLVGGGASRRPLRVPEDAESPSSVRLPLEHEPQGAAEGFATGRRRGEAPTRPRRPTESFWDLGFRLEHCGAAHVTRQRAPAVAVWIHP